MAYCTLANITDQESVQTLVQLTDDENTGVMDETKVDAAILSADAEIDGYLQSRYPTLPLPPPVPQVVINISRNIAIYELYSRRGQGSVPENVASRASRSRQMLVDIAKGVISLGASAPVSAAGIYKGNKTACDQVYGPGSLAGFGPGASVR